MTQQWRTVRPGADERAEYYAGYIAEVPDGDLVATLEAQVREFTGQIRAIPESRGGFRYAEGKWSIRQVVQHINDAERVFSFRLLWFARADASALPGFDENAWVPASGAEQRTLAGLADEFAAIRAATLLLCRSLPDDVMQRRGTASGREFSASALAWIMAGHANHHAAVLRERYR